MCDGRIRGCTLQGIGKPGIINNQQGSIVTWAHIKRGQIIMAKTIRMHSNITFDCAFPVVYMHRQSRYLPRIICGQGIGTPRAISIIRAFVDRVLANWALSLASTQGICIGPTDRDIGLCALLFVENFVHQFTSYLMFNVNASYS